MIATPFEPHRLLLSGHAQTVAGRYWLGSRVRLRSQYHEIAMADGDRLAVLESVPASWPEDGAAVILVHGLAGCARSPYVARFARKLVARGIRVVRMNLRGAGAGFGLARGIYHAGRSDDLRAVADWLISRAPDTRVGLVGFSLGGNLVLKLAAEAATSPVAGLDCVVAASPPLDLAACCRFLQRPGGRVYDLNFVRLLRREVTRLHAAFPDLEPVNLDAVRTLYDFDDLYTARRNGFRSADHYYATASAAPLLHQIRVPGLIVHAVDDPFIPPEPFQGLALPPSLQMELLPRGGHLGFVSQLRLDGDRHWLDARLIHWLARSWPRFQETGDSSTLVPPSGRHSP